MVWNSKTIDSTTSYSSYSGWRNNGYYYSNTRTVERPKPKKIIVHNNFPKRRNLRFLSNLNPRKWTPNINEALKFTEEDLEKVKKIIGEIHEDFEKADWTFV
jgi:hypothetical protein